MKLKAIFFILFTIILSFSSASVYAAASNSGNSNASNQGLTNGVGHNNGDIAGTDYLGDDEATPLEVVEPQADTNAPLEDWLGVLVVAGIAFGMKKAHDRRKMEQVLAL